MAPAELAFPPAWAVLYTAMAVAAWLVWRVEGWGLALTLWAVQLVINAGWSALFFGMRRPDLAFLDVAALWVTIAATIAAFGPVHEGAAWLMVPYLAWVTFAAALNLSIWRRNRTRLAAPVRP